MKKIVAPILAVCVVASLGITSFAVNTNKDTLNTSSYTKAQSDLALFVGADNKTYDEAMPLSDDFSTPKSVWSIAKRVYVKIDEDEIKHKEGLIDGFANDPNDLVVPGVTLYIALDSFNVYSGKAGVTTLPASEGGVPVFDYDDLTVKVKKGENSKYVKSITIVDKEFVMDEIAHVTDGEDSDLPGVDIMRPHDRRYFAKVELKDYVIDNEIPLTFKIEFKAKKTIDASHYWYNIYDNGEGGLVAAQPGYGSQFPDPTIIPAGTKITIESDRLYVNNKILNGDNDFNAGVHGTMVKPSKNDDNEVTWENADGTIARVKFLGDSDTNKYYAKLSTKWDNALYADQFEHTNAYIYDFTAGPSFSGVTRVTMELANPFINSDGDEMIDPKEIIIYAMEENGDISLTDVTSEFTYTENADGDMMFISKGRTYTKYIFTADAAKVAGGGKEEVRVATGIKLPSRDK